MTDADKSDEPDPVEITFTGVHAVSPVQAAIPAVIDEWAEENQDHTLVCHWLGDHYRLQPVENSNAGVCVLDEGEQKLLAVGVDGEVDVRRFFQTGTAEIGTEQITGAEGPSYSLLLRCARRIGGQLFAAGMARQVYRRERPGVWTAIDAGTFSPRAERGTAAIGFNGIDGPTADEIWAVGFGGEIWHWRGGVWRQIDSPTNIALNAVVCTPGGDVYACGMAGLLLKGRGDAWELIHHAETTDDFWSITCLGERVFVSSYDGVFRIEAETLERVDLRLPGTTTAYLDAGGGSLWSVGAKHVAVSTNGEEWSRVRLPVVRI